MPTRLTTIDSAALAAVSGGFTQAQNDRALVACEQAASPNHWEQALKKDVVCFEQYAKESWKNWAEPVAKDQAR